MEIIGEESMMPSKINDCLQSGDIDHKMIELFSGEDCEVSMEDCILWIDPLDGTGAFLEEDLEAITTLIGLSYKGEPLLGLVTQHFPNGEYNPVCYFSHKNQQQVYFVSVSDLSNIQIIKRDSLVHQPLSKDPEFSAGPLRLVCTKSRYDQRMDYILNEVI